MVKKTLENKIKDTIFGVIIFFILYGIIGFLLETSWLSTSVGLPKIYEIFKDGLTITASFLAPVTAFVLFSHWSEQHSAVRNEKEVIKLLKETKGINREVDDIEDFITGYHSIGFSKAELIEYDKKVGDLFGRTYHHFDNLVESAKNFKNREFHKVCIDLVQKQIQFLVRVVVLVQTTQNLEQCKLDSNAHGDLPGLINDENRASSHYYAAAESYKLYSEEIKPEIEKLADEHRIL
ncbi:hypothetical protein F3J02_03730 [Acinetobacter sp. Tr-809]|uniref:hypothetical protein n=1 Tax=Acinetobacter sp. Tr-809 TaxID=2608324 RepID=UPI00141FAE53|nr:hypothetical protein [Acinetobacter sp. Tr-809]NIE95600.1 hypothetical protein [Acinetobacter sp. Tr-809]